MSILDEIRPPLTLENMSGGSQRLSFSHREWRVHLFGHRESRAVLLLVIAREDASPPEAISRVLLPTWCEDLTMWGGPGL